MVLHEKGLSDCAIARHTGVPRSTVRDWRVQPVPRSQRSRDKSIIEELPAGEYAYLLGLYLGDGYLAPRPQGRTCRQLRIYLDAQYPAIILECARALESLFPGRRAGIQLHHKHAMALVSLYSTRWERLLPQHGSGMKHTRRIELEAWQHRLVESEPGRFIRGLIHSDGSRTINRVRSPAGKEYIYPRYEFCNKSQDIKDLFCHACDLIGVEWRVMNAMTISVARRGSVAILDEFVGPKC